MFNIHSHGLRKTCGVFLLVQFDQAFSESFVYYLICSSNFCIGKVNTFPFMLCLHAMTNCNAINGVAKKYAHLPIVF